MFYLIEGMVKRYTITSKGEELVLNIYSSPAFFPMAWLINNTRLPHYFEALTDVTVWKAPKNKTLEFILDEPDILFFMLQRVYINVETTWLRLQHYMGGNVQNRLLAELYFYSRRFGVRKDNQTTLKIRLSQKNLASFLGIARETVSRLIARLKKRGLITHQKGIFTLTNIKKIEEELSRL